MGKGGRAHCPVSGANPGRCIPTLPYPTLPTPTPYLVGPIQAAPQAAFHRPLSWHCMLYGVALSNTDAKVSYRPPLIV